LLTGTLGGCMQSTSSREEAVAAPDEASPGPGTNIGSLSTYEIELDKNRELPKELVMQLLDQKVVHYMQLSHHCAQSSFLALKEQFGLKGEEVVKALTPLTGIAERGETCGAVTGPLMAMGLIFGRNELQLDDWETYRASLIPAGKFCDRFEKAFGSTMCHVIQEGEFGRCYHLTDPEELRAFQEADATVHCTEVVKKAVRMAAGIILEQG
jgi:C_GCAxxG_C_C family probable redox protein